jgi:CRP-like cAMP-binding protein
VVCSPAELRTLFLFEKLTDDQLAWLCREGHIEYVEPGVLYTEGAPAEKLYVLLQGTLVMSRRVGADDIETGRTSSVGVYAGAFMAYLGDRVPQLYNNSVRVTEPSRFFVLGADRFAQLMNDWFPMAVHLLEGLIFGQRSVQEAVGQRERLLALGSLSAGLTHELNNPASAAVRATAALRERVAGMRHKLGLIAAAPRGAGCQGTVTQPAGGLRRRRCHHRLARRPRRHPRLGSGAGLRAGGPGHSLARPGGRDHGRGTGSG